MDETFPDSPALQALLLDCIQVDATLRPDANDALACDWIDESWQARLKVGK